MPFDTIFSIRIDSTKLDLSQILNKIEKRDRAICSFIDEKLLLFTNLEFVF